VATVTELKPPQSVTHQQTVLHIAIYHQQSLCSFFVRGIDGIADGFSWQNRP